MQNTQAPVEENISEGNQNLILHRSDKEVRQFKNLKNSETWYASRVVHPQHKTIFCLCGISVLE